jgi:hypothetical protein
MRVTSGLALAMAAAAITASPALACEMEKSADSGGITIATGPEPETPQTPILIPPTD